MILSSVSRILSSVNMILNSVDRILNSVDRTYNPSKPMKSKDFKFCRQNLEF